MPKVGPVRTESRSIRHWRMHVFWPVRCRIACFEWLRSMAQPVVVAALVDSLLRLVPIRFDLCVLFCLFVCFLMFSGDRLGFDRVSLPFWFDPVVETSENEQRIVLRESTTTERRIEIKMALAFLAVVQKDATTWRRVRPYVVPWPWTLPLSLGLVTWSGRSPVWRPIIGSITFSSASFLMDQRVLHRFL